MQIGLARDTTARFLPIFRVNHPDITWPDILLSDLDGYYDEHEQGMPDDSDAYAGGDAAFDFALCALLRAKAYAKEGNLPRVTPACCTALIAAVSARATNVWHADDPEAVRAFEVRDAEALAGRTVHDNVASQAVKKREWQMVAEWLERHRVGDYPDTQDAERERWFEWWLEREGLL
ncbi:hypothetical protein [Haliangium sp.]